MEFGNNQINNVDAIISNLNNEINVDNLINDLNSPLKENNGPFVSSQYLGNANIRKAITESSLNYIAQQSIEFDNAFNRPNTFISRSLNNNNAFDVNYPYDRYKKSQLIKQQQQQSTQQQTDNKGYFFLKNPYNIEAVQSTPDISIKNNIPVKSDDKIYTLNTKELYEQLNNIADNFKQLGLNNNGIRNVLTPLKNAYDIAIKNNLNNSNDNLVLKESEINKIQEASNKVINTLNELAEKRNKVISIISDSKKYIDSIKNTGKPLVQYLESPNFKLSDLTLGDVANIISLGINPATAYIAKKSDYTLNDLGEDITSVAKGLYHVAKGNFVAMSTAKDVLFDNKDLQQLYKEHKLSNDDIYDLSLTYSFGKTYLNNFESSIPFTPDSWDYEAAKYMDSTMEQLNKAFPQYSKVTSAALNTSTTLGIGSEMAIEALITGVLVKGAIAGGRAVYSVAKTINGGNKVVNAIETTEGISKFSKGVITAEAIAKDMSGARKVANIETITDGSKIISVGEDTKNISEARRIVPVLNEQAINSAKNIIKESTKIESMEAKSTIGSKFGNMFIDAIPFADMAQYAIKNRALASTARFQYTMGDLFARNITAIRGTVNESKQEAYHQIIQLEKNPQFQSLSVSEQNKLKDEVFNMVFWQNAVILGLTEKLTPMYNVAKSMMKIGESELAKTGINEIKDIGLKLQEKELVKGATTKGMELVAENPLKNVLRYLFVSGEFSPLSIRYAKQNISEVIQENLQDIVQNYTDNYVNNYINGNKINYSYIPGIDLSWWNEAGKYFSDPHQWLPTAIQTYQTGGLIGLQGYLLHNTANSIMGGITQSEYKEQLKKTLILNDILLNKKPIDIIIAANANGSLYNTIKQVKLNKNQTMNIKDVVLQETLYSLIKSKMTTPMIVQLNSYKALYDELRANHGDEVAVERILDLIATNTNDAISFKDINKLSAEQKKQVVDSFFDDVNTFKQKLSNSEDILNKLEQIVPPVINNTFGLSKEQKRENEYNNRIKELAREQTIKSLFFLKSSNDMTMDRINDMSLALSNLVSSANNTSEITNKLAIYITSPELIEEHSNTIKNELLNTFKNSFTELVQKLGYESVKQLMDDIDKGEELILYDVLNKVLDNISYESKENDSASIIDLKLFGKVKDYITLRTIKIIRDKSFRNEYNEIDNIINDPILKEVLDNISSVLSGIGVEELYNYLDKNVNNKEHLKILKWIIDSIIDLQYININDDKNEIEYINKLLKDIVENIIIKNTITKRGRKKTKYKIININKLINIIDALKKTHAFSTNPELIDSIMFIDSALKDIINEKNKKKQNLKTIDYDIELIYYELNEIGNKFNEDRTKQSLSFEALKQIIELLDYKNKNKKSIVDIINKHIENNNQLNNITAIFTMIYGDDFDVNQIKKINEYIVDAMKMHNESKQLSLLYGLLTNNKDVLFNHMSSIENGINNINKKYHNEILKRIKYKRKINKPILSKKKVSKQLNNINNTLDKKAKTITVNEQQPQQQEQQQPQQQEQQNNQFNDESKIKDANIDVLINTLINNWDIEENKTDVNDIMIDILRFEKYLQLHNTNIVSFLISNGYNDNSSEYKLLKSIYNKIFNYDYFDVPDNQKIKLLNKQISKIGLFNNKYNLMNEEEKANYINKYFKNNIFKVRNLLNTISNNVPNINSYDILIKYLNKTIYILFLKKRMLSEVLGKKRFVELFDWAQELLNSDNPNDNAELQSLINEYSELIESINDELEEFINDELAPETIEDANIFFNYIISGLYDLSNEMDKSEELFRKEKRNTDRYDANYIYNHFMEIVNKNSNLMNSLYLMYFIYDYIEKYKLNEPENKKIYDDLISILSLFNEKLAINDNEDTMSLILFFNRLNELINSQVSDNILFDEMSIAFSNAKIQDIFTKIYGSNDIINNIKEAIVNKDINKLSQLIYPQNIIPLIKAFFDTKISENITIGDLVNHINNNVVKQSNIQKETKVKEDDENNNNKEEEEEENANELDDITPEEVEEVVKEITDNKQNIAQSTIMLNKTQQQVLSDVKVIAYKIFKKELEYGVINLSDDALYNIYVKIVNGKITSKYGIYKLVFDEIFKQLDIRNKKQLVDIIKRMYSYNENRLLNTHKKYVAEVINDYKIDINDVIQKETKQVTKKKTTQKITKKQPKQQPQQQLQSEQQIESIKANEELEKNKIIDEEITPINIEVADLKKQEIQSTQNTNIENVVETEESKNENKEVKQINTNKKREQKLINKIDNNLNTNNIKNSTNFADNITNKNCKL